MHPYREVGYPLERMPIVTYPFVLCQWAIGKIKYRAVAFGVGSFAIEYAQEHVDSFGVSSCVWFAKNPAYCDKDEQHATIVELLKQVAQMKGLT